MNDNNNNKFNYAGLIPKNSTQAKNFLKKYPKYDGTGIKVAILDTGVSLGVKGLEVTTNGNSKIIDVVDCTGSGDVLMKDLSKNNIKINENNENEYIINGLSGRKLYLGKEWVDKYNSSLNFKIGIKSGYELFPSMIIKRLKKNNNNKFKTINNEMLAKAKIELNKFNKKYDKSKLENNRDLLLEKINLESKIKILEKNNSSSDPGPIYDILSFRDEEEGIWRGIIDTQCNGDLREKPPLLTNYKAERQFSKFDDISELNYCLNFYDNGNMLSIVVDSGAHGTHVAAIVGANFPENPELNGVAPGCEIISYKIGDKRIDGMETGPGIIRALNLCASSGVDIINMSFGEPTQTPDLGRIQAIARELVLKHHVIFISSGKK